MFLPIRSRLSRYSRHALFRFALLPGILGVLAAGTVEAQISSGGNQRFHIGDGDTNANPVNLACGGFWVTNAGNMRIIIPASFNMTFDTSITAPTITGTTAKVAGTVSYPNSKTMFLDVTADFIPGESVTISGLQFRNFGNAELPDNLEFDFTGDSVADAFDPFTIRIAANPTMLSGANQTFNVGDSATTISPITVTEAGANLTSIWATTDIRIRIPAGFNMTWNTADTTATLGGSAAGRVSSTVTYEDASRTLRLNVLSDFAFGETLVVSNLSFNNFSGISSPDNLELEVNNQNDIADFDFRTIEVGGVATISSAGNQAFTVGDPATAISTITITEALGVPTINTVNDIRVEIPNSFNMTWNTADTVASYGGTASGRVSVNVVYENGGRTLVIPVTSNFLAGETLTVSGLSFANFTAASGVDTLDLEVDGDGPPEAVDSSTKAIGAPTLSSNGDQVFQIGDPTTLISPFTVTDDGANARITAANDIRVIIPAGFNMEWDTTDLTASIAGSAAGRVSGTVSYVGTHELVLNVTSNFLPGESITVSNLSFTNFAGPSLPDNLELEVNNLNTVADLDSQIIAVGGAPTLVSASDQAFTVNDPATTAASFTVTDANGFPTITAANDLRIRIPATFNMTWNTADTAAVFGGTAAARAANPVAYEDGGRTLVVNVISDFQINETLTVSGLSFTSFSGASLPDTLELEVDNAGTVAGLDASTIAIGAPTILSNANQAFGTGDPSTPMAAITVTDDGTTARISAAGDIRIRIPATFNMTWDPASTVATFGGSAAAKVQNPVTYEDGNRTLVVDVTADFAPGEAVVISGLSFANFTAESAVDMLELEVNDLNTVAALDTRTVLISNRPTVVSAVTGDVTQNGSIDQLLVTFSEDVNGSSPSVIAGTGFTLAGYSIALGNEIAPGVVLYVLAEIGIPDTGVLPAFTYDPLVGALDDLNGLTMTDPGPFPVFDGAPPRIVGFTATDTDGNGFLDNAVFTYSEALAAGQEDLSDWSLIDADGVTDLLVGLTDLDVVIAGSTLTITLADVGGTAGVPRYRYLEDALGGAIQDGSGNIAPTDTNNSAPLANAGIDQTVMPGVVQLDGSGSDDIDGQPLTFSWAQSGGPVVTLSDPASDRPTFLARTPATYSFTLTVDDGLQTSNDTVDIFLVNAPPHAHAGFDQTVLSGAIVNLDGTASGDVNGDVIGFSWIQIAGPPVLLANPNLATPNFNPAGINGVLEFELTVTDAGPIPDVDTVRVIVNDPGNGVPTAHAGADQVRTVGTLVTLDGRLSSDGDGDPLTYSWSPPGLLSDPSLRNPTFTPVAPGLYTFQLVVTDFLGVDSAPDEIQILVVEPGNQAPLAVPSRLSPAADVVLGDLVTLDSAGSVDPEGGALQFAWTQVSGPRTLLSNAAAAQPTFGPPMAGTYVFQLFANDGAQSSFPATIAVHVKSLAPDVIPFARADIDPTDDPDGDSRVSVVTAPIALDGTGSIGAGLSFDWVQTGGPHVVTSAPTGAITDFVPLVAGAFEFTLVVTDANGLQSIAVRTVIVDTPGNEVPEADAGPDDVGSAGQTVSLDGTASFDSTIDADGVTDFTNGLLAFWSQDGGPPVALSDPFAASPTFVPSTAGTYVFVLTLHDGTDTGTSDRVTIVVGAAPMVGGGGDSSTTCALLGLEALLFLLALRRRRRLG